MVTSEQAYARAIKVMPAGVNSPVRAFRSVGGTPLFMDRGQGAYLFDVEGRRYLDFCGSWGPLILGHRHPNVERAMVEAISKGWTFGTPVTAEVDLAEFLVDRLEPVEMIRFVNSGTEAVMSAIRLARGVTGRDRVLKFRGCYHGHVDYLLVEAGSGLATFGTASSSGVPAAFAELTATMPLDDLPSLETFFSESGQQLACVIIEGVPANNGLLIQDAAYMHHLRKLCDQYGCLLILDEVLSGFRMPAVTAWDTYQVRPDLVTLGKVIGGGMPVGAYGGRADLMKHIAPLGNVYQAGTLSGNPVAMSAGLATLKTYYEANIPAKLEQIGQHLDQCVARALGDQGDTGYVRLGSLFWFYFYADRAPKRADHIDSRCGDVYARLHRFMLEKGFYLAPSAYEVGFLNGAMTEAEMENFGNALQSAKEEGVFS